MRPVLVLRIYVDRSSQWCKSNQLFIYRGSEANKHRLSHLIRDAISMDFKPHGLASPLGIRGNSTRSVASSKALARETSLQDVCAAASWSSLRTHLLGFTDWTWIQSQVLKSFWVFKSFLYVCMLHNLVGQAFFSMASWVLTFL